MDPSRPKRILEDWATVASAARRPSTAPRPVVVRSGLPGATLAGASLVVVGLAIAGLLLGRQPGPGVGGSSPSTSREPTSTATSAAPATGLCGPANLGARITMWEGAAGHRIAHVELAVVRAGPCDIEAMARPQLMDGRGVILIDGSTPSTSARLTIASGDVLTTLVQAGNYCGPTPVAPATVAFVFSDGTTIVALPVSPDDAVFPSCLGSGEPGTVEMHPWAR